MFHAGNGRELPGAGLSNKDGQPQRFVATGWFELHQLLRKHLQPNTIQLGKRLAICSQYQFALGMPAILKCHLHMAACKFKASRMKPHTTSLPVALLPSPI